MNLKDFKLLHHQFSQASLPEEVLQSAEYKLYVKFLFKNKEFFKWVAIQDFKNAGFDYKKMCCRKMADRIFEGLHKNGNMDLDNKDVVMRKWPDGTFGIPIQDGGAAIIKIKFCPWCGKKLKKSIH
jgi:hypothetical protein